MRRLVMVVTVLAACVMPALAADPPKAADAPKPASEFAALPAATRQKVEDLASRLQKWYNEGMVMDPGDASRRPQIDAKGELDSFCTTPDLVELLGAMNSDVREPAYWLLLDTRNKDLKAKDIERLCQYLEVTDPEKNWQGLRAGAVLAKNQALGIPALVNLFKTSKSPAGRVHAAGILAKTQDGALAAEKRQAQQVLLESLGNADDSARLAQNAISPLEPWMVEYLAKAVLAAKDDSPLWTNGVAILAYSSLPGQEELLRSVLLKALKNPSASVRMNAVDGLRAKGLRKEDLALYQAIQKDEDKNVRSRLYVAMQQKPEPWMAPLLVDGLADANVETVETCAWGLAALKHKAAVPKLVEILKKAPTGEKDIFDKPYRAVGEALADLTGQPFKFHIDTRPAGLATVIVNRSTEYKAEAVRVLRWWQDTGSKQEW